MGVLRRDPLVEEGQRLLTTLFNETVRDMHTNHPDSRRFEEVAAKAGMGVVGNPSTMTKPALAFRDLEKVGLVERVKDVDGPLRYKMTIAGVRYVMQLELAAAEMSWRSQVDTWQARAVHHEDEERKLAEENVALRQELRDAEGVIDGLLERPKPWYSRLAHRFRRTPDEVEDDDGDST